MDYTMFTIISLIIGFFYILWLNSLIRFGVKTASRIAVATEASARNTAILVEMAQARASNLGFDAVARELAQ
jgi:predicted Na+-dependent transporter